MNYIGVDVDSQYLVCKAWSGEEHQLIRQFDNNPVGYRQFIKWARYRGADARVCMEATGVYALPFTLALNIANGIEVSVVNPKAIKRFADASMQRGKSDALDAERILEFLLRMEFRSWQSTRASELKMFTEKPPHKPHRPSKHHTQNVIQKRLAILRLCKRHHKNSACNFLPLLVH